MPEIAVYQAEIQDGIAEQVSKSGAIAYLQVAKPTSTPHITPSLLDDKSIATNLGQKDLYYIDAILASTGWNNNDDIFLKEEIWKAKSSPIDKPINFQHDFKDIIGHITESFVIDGENKVIASDTDFKDVPDTFDIVTQGVVYKEWDDKERNSFISELMKEVAAGQWFVSMECLFPSFDYGVRDKDGLTKILARSEATAFLTKHLRLYGGTGEFVQNGTTYKIGRALRNFFFSAKGFVKEPGNPNSIFRSVSSLTLSDSDNLIISEKSGYSKKNETQGENLMADATEKLEKEVADKNAEIAKLTAALKEKDDKVAQGKISELTDTITGKDKSIAELTSKVDELNKEVANTKTVLDETKKALDAAKAELDKAAAEIKKTAEEKSKAERLAVLAKKGLDGDKATAILEKFAALTDVQFAAIAELIPVKTEEKPVDEDKTETEEKSKADALIEKNTEEKEKSLAGAQTTENDSYDFKALAGVIKKNIPVKKALVNAKVSKTESEE